MVRITACLLMLLMIVFTVPVSADEVTDAQNELKALQKQIDAQKSLISKTKTQEKSVTQVISSLEKQIAQAQKEIQTLGTQVNNKQLSIEQTQTAIQAREADLTERSRYLANRLVQIHEMGDGSYLEVILGAESFSDMLTRFDMLATIVKQDSSLIKDINQERDALVEQKDELTKQKDELLTIRQNEQDKKVELAAATEVKEDYLKEIQGDRKKYEQALNQLENESKELEAIILKAQSGGKYTGTGIFAWPLPTNYRTITSEYGMRYHPILKVRKLHSGMDIAAPTGTKIMAADSGKVIYRGSMGGNGNVIVIDHGGGISTLYAHMSAFVAQMDQQVTKGQEIGKVGMTGWTTGPHLHFEVRKNGSPVNPRSYVKP